jgi:hypothetical protein
VTFRLFLLALAFASETAAAQAGIPRTTDGKPDFTGVWANDFLPSMMERIAGATSLSVSDEEAATLLKALHERRDASFFAVYDPDENYATMRLPQVAGDWRTSVITEPPHGKAPITPEGQRLVDEALARLRGFVRGEELTSDPEERTPSERCLTGPGLPPFGGYQIQQIRQIVQTPHHLVIHTEYIGETRIIDIGGSHKPGRFGSAMGNSTAGWEDDVLVIETAGFTPGRPVVPGILVRPEARVIERLSLISTDEILYQFTIENPAIYSARWNAEYGIQRSSARLLEGACHEGNSSLGNILRGARVIEQRTAGK